MASKILIVVSLFLLLISTSTVTVNILNDVTKAVLNLILLAQGGVKFLIEYAEFSSKQLSDITPSNQEKFDFIIVGSGSAGATIAARLSEISDFKVLLIEAGGKENLIMDIPIICPLLVADKKITWNYKTPPSQDYCIGLNNNQCNVVPGKCLGGSSATNFLIATRGTRKNYDRWAEATGDQTWSYNGMLKYFKKLETTNVKSVQVDSNYRGFNGPIRITELDYRTPLADAFIAAGRELGYPAPIDYNGPSDIGFTYLQTNQLNGERLSTNRAYLNPIKSRENIFVTMNSHTNKVLIDPNTKTAYGVEFTKNGRTIRVRANKEVILSAGAIGSSKLLMLSGVGPARELQALNIPVIQDAPVGENLMDHVTFSELTFFENASLSLSIAKFLDPRNPSISDYLTKRTGPLTVPSFIEALAFVDVDDLESEEPNIELIYVNAHIATSILLHEILGMKESYFKESFEDSLNRYGYAIWPVLLQPKSRGKVSLKSADPKADPIIKPNYFSDPDDMRVLVKALRLAMKIGDTKAMKKYGSQRYKYTIPGCDKYENDSDDFWACALRAYTQTLWHHSGTCKMGRTNDTTAVVNSDLQVKNIKNLRVGDTSIMPIIPSAHTNIPAIAIGEILSDKIKSYWGYSIL